VSTICFSPSVAVPGVTGNFSRIAVCSAAATEAYGSQQTNGSAEDSLTVTSHLSALNGAEPSGVVSAKPNNLRVALAD